ncbi:hypothetical protein GALMADRAFT_677400 [Galerina marginata CBS 339.88]|uniref:Secreted protein n=1 Tax=Galerina marginata (strain CBS 339.88) TaxID=685588 RepID=A0A067TXP2_GALM3|nr:hypothetical protein GALMADRAFT_677400 [Galerina marginata CBS 339.88]
MQAALVSFSVSHVYLACILRILRGAVELVCPTRCLSQFLVMTANLPGICTVKMDSKSFWCVQQPWSNMIGPQFLEYVNHLPCSKSGPM